MHVEAGGIHVHGPHREGKGPVGLLGYLQEECRHPHRIQAVQHPPHAVVVEEIRGDALPQEPPRGLALPEVAEEVERRGHKAQRI